MMDIDNTSYKRLTDEQITFLNRMAEKYLWWKREDDRSFNPKRIMVQVMTMGTWEDMVALERIMDFEKLKDALKETPSGVMNERSWHFWHYRLGLVEVDGDVPPMPRRQIA